MRFWPALLLLPLLCIAVVAHAQLIPFGFWKTPAATCGGVSVGGYCWYKGTAYPFDGESCDTVCTGHGGCNLTGTKDYAGSGGSTANCTAVLNALSIAGSASDAALGAGMGCSVWNFGLGGNNYRDTSATTTCGAGTSGTQRVCACNS